MGLAESNIEQIEHRSNFEAGEIPAWVPRSVKNYLDHIELGIPIRALAREQGCHASTILRQIRRIETLRDDPLVDGVLKTLGGGEENQALPVNKAVSASAAVTAVADKPELPDASELSVHALRVLRRLCETGAVLAVAADMEKGVIVRQGHGVQTTRTGVVERKIAEAMALKGWIVAPTEGRIAQYQITAAGRSALADMMAHDESAKAKGTVDQDGHRSGDTPRRIRYGVAESPLVALARRRDSTGAPFLSDNLVTAGERLREDFELAQLEQQGGRDWEEFLTDLRADALPESTQDDVGTSRAHARVVAALRDLGPGLSDVTLRCCCILEGLETAEKKLGWSARSGKIVLRIALMRLKRHYAQDVNLDGAMIG